MYFSELTAKCLNSSIRCKIWSSTKFIEQKLGDYLINEIIALRTNAFSYLNTQTVFGIYYNFERYCRLIIVTRPFYFHCTFLKITDSNGPQVSWPLSAWLSPSLEFYSSTNRKDIPRQRLQQKRQCQRRIKGKRSKDN